MLFGMHRSADATPNIYPAGQPQPHSGWLFSAGFVLLALVNGIGIWGVGFIDRRAAR